MERFENFNLEELEELRYALSKLISEGAQGSEGEKMYHEIMSELSKRE